MVHVAVFFFLLCSKENRLLINNSLHPTLKIKMAAIPSFTFKIPTWALSVTPTSTTLSSIDATFFPALTLQFASATLALAHETKLGSLYKISQVIRGAEASLTIIEAQSILATATNDAVKSEITKAIFDATLNLEALTKSKSPYGTDLNFVANCMFAAVFFIIFNLHVFMMTWLHLWYFGGCLLFGCCLEFAGYLSRTFAVHHPSSSVYFLIQIISITVAPAFTMAGIYYLLGKLAVIHGRTHSLLKPMSYSVIFIVCDVISLVVQAAGGAIAASRVVLYENPALGTHIMEAGIAFQVFSMTLFLYFWFDFIFRIFFHVNPEAPFSFKMLGSLLWNGKRAHYIRTRKLEPFYDPQFKHIRLSKYFNYFPMFITILTLLVYVRCIYRAIELAQGWTGYLMTHEIYLMTLDATMTSITGILCLVFHPVFLFSKDQRLPLKETILLQQSPKDDLESCSLPKQLNQQNFSCYCCRADHCICQRTPKVLASSIFTEDFSYVSDYLTIYPQENAFFLEKEAYWNDYHSDNSHYHNNIEPCQLSKIPSLDDSSVSSEFYFA